MRPRGRLPRALTTASQHAAPRRRSALAGAAMSFLLPGLGQWYLGRHASAVLFALPILIMGALLALQLYEGLTVFAARLLEPSFALTLLLLVILAGIWRLVSMLDA